jgi:hypothetical protein
MDQNLSLQEIADQLYAFLADRFPVCCFSDEFYYFPQALNPDRDWSQWDDFSPGAVREAVSDLKKFRISLENTQGEDEERGSGCTRRLLIWHLLVLFEQLEEIKLHTTRPTFILTIATAGILEALQNKDRRALDARLGALPIFLERATGSLELVPTLFMESGLEMSRNLKRWIAGLGEGSATVNSSTSQNAIGSVDLFAKNLSRIPTTVKFRLDPDQFERIVKVHSGSGLTVDQALAELEDEELELGGLVKEEGQKLANTGDMNLVYEKLDHEELPKCGAEKRAGTNCGDGPEASMVRLLSLETERLKNHCAQLGVLAATHSPEVKLQPLPASLATVRAADSYNAIPGTPFRGGTFYVYGGGTLGQASGSVHPSYRMTVAHETFPGHHLLDTSRWNHPDPVRRPLEYPLFYEGWACFGEELMHMSGALDKVYDRFLLYWRRYRHAVRGKTDLLLHSGRIDLAGAASLLVGAGFEKGRAAETARKYALQPAYQMCYTIGRRKFQSLFRSENGERIPDFMNSVLAEGELLFQDLEEVLKEPGARSLEPGESTKTRKV